MLQSERECLKRRRKRIRAGEKERREKRERAWKKVGGNTERVGHRAD